MPTDTPSIDRRPGPTELDRSPDETLPLLSRFGALVLAHRWWVIAGWLLLTVAGVIAAPHAVANLSQRFDLPGEPAYETNQQLATAVGSGGDNAPVLIVLHADRGDVPDSAGAATTAAVRDAVPDVRLASFADHPALRSGDGATAVVLVYPPVSAESSSTAPDLHSIPKLTTVAARLDSALPGVDVRVTGENATQATDGGSTSVLVETLFGAVGALIVLAIVFGSLLAITPLVVAGASILSTFLALWGISSVTDVSAVVEFLLALIGLGVAIDYSLLIVTRWREELGRGRTPDQAIRSALATAGRSVLFSGLTVAISLAALTALPVPFLRSIGFSGLLIPLISVAAALTLLPALLSLAGRRLAWPHRRSSDSRSRLWNAFGSLVVRHRSVSAVLAAAIMVALALPVLGIRLGSATNDSLASGGGSSAAALSQVQRSGIGAGLTQPVEIVTDHADAITARLADVDGVAGTVAPRSWHDGSAAIVDAWTTADASTATGANAAARVREIAQHAGAIVGGTPAENADYVSAVYGNAWAIALIIGAVTFVLLAVALRSWVLPVKAIVLNVLSLSAAYGITVLIWQHGFLTETLFGQPATGAITVWVPIGVFAFLFGLSMDYEVFLLSRIREEHDSGRSTDQATVHGVARTGRLVTSGALILFLAFVSLSRVPSTDVKIFATALALGIALDATIVRGVLAPALVAALGRVNWMFPARWRGRSPQTQATDREGLDTKSGARTAPQFPSG